MIPAAFAPIVSHLWQSTLFAAVADLLTLALRRNQARVRYALWLAASYKFLLPFSWLVMLGRQFEWRSAPAIMPHAISTVTDMVSAPIFLMPTAAAWPTPDRFSALPFVIWSVWACGFMVVTWGWVREWLRIRAMVRAASPRPGFLGGRSFSSDIKASPSGVSTPEAPNWFSSAGCRVVSVPSRLEPGVFGIFRPVLLLPEGIEKRLTPAQLQAVIAHELCHVRRRDNLAAAVHMLVEAVFWFHPLVWWLDARIIDERERACDEEVLRLGGEPQAYVETILTVCKSYIESPVACMTGISGSDLKKRIAGIMASRLAEKLTFGRKVLLATAGVAALAGPLAFGIANAGPARARQASDAPLPAFEVASVKPTSPDYRAIGTFLVYPGGRLDAEGCTLNMLIVKAYGLQTFQVSGGPKWADEDRFSINAKPPADSKSSKINPTNPKLPPPEEELLMLRALLAERFQLVLHQTTQQESGLALVLKNGKPNLLDAKDKDAFPVVTSGYTDESDRPWDFQGINASMTMLAARLSDVLMIPVVDQTGLEGSFDFTIKYAKSSDTDAAGPQLPTAIQEIGLKLESAKVPALHVEVERAEKPSEN